MRNYIHDDTLLLFLSAIEDHLGYTISAETLPESMWSTHGGAMGLREGKWQFWYNPNDPPTQLTLLHELLHIVLFIEVWASWLVHPNSIRDHIDSMLYDFITNFAPHIQISQMVEDLGYSEREQIARDMGRFARGIQREHEIPPHHRLAWIQIEVLNSASLLLAQSDPHAKEQFRISLQQWRPKLVGVIDAICSVSAKLQPLDGKSADRLVFEILPLLKMQIGNLMPLRIGKMQIGLFSRICAQVGRGHS